MLELEDKLRHFQEKETEVNKHKNKYKLGRKLSNLMMKFRKKTSRNMHLNQKCVISFKSCFDMQGSKGDKEEQLIKQVKKLIQLREIHKKKVMYVLFGLGVCGSYMNLCVMII